MRFAITLLTIVAIIASPVYGCRITQQRIVQAGYRLAALLKTVVE